MEALAPILQELESRGLTLDPRLVLALAAALPIAALAVAYVVRARKARGDGGGKDGGAPAPAKAALPPKDLLTRVWKRFLGELPSLYRRSIGQFQPFVVMGAAGSGKSRLVDTYTDWRRQAKQSAVSSLEDPNLQIYLGSRALVLEPHGALLHDTSRRSRELHLRLWRTLFRKRRPIVVVAVDVKALQASPPDAVRGLADTVRGKVNLIAQAHGKPVEVRLALTHLDEVEGYGAFSRFVAQQRVPARVQLEASDQDYVVEGNLQERFAALDRLLPLALTTMSAADYAQVVAFLREAPRVLPVVSAFVSALFVRDTLSLRPSLEGLYFTAAEHGGGRLHPFHLAEAQEPVPDPLALHRVLALGAVAAGLLYLGVGYWNEHRLWTPAREAAIEYAQATTPAREARLRAQMRGFFDRHQQVPLTRAFPTFFRHGERQVQEVLVEGVRRNVLLPGLDRALSGDYPHRRSIYFLGVLYATRDNPLGEEVLKPQNGWPEATGLDAGLIADYVRFADRPYGRPPELQHLPAQVPPSPANDPQPWLLFFRRLERTIAGGFVSPAELSDLQAEAARLSEAVTVIQRFKATTSTLSLLDGVTGYDLRTTYAPFVRELGAQELFGGSLGQVDELLRVVRKARIEVANPQPVLLADLVARLKLVLDTEAGAPPAGDAWAVRVDGQAFVFHPAQLAAVIRQSTARELVLSFVQRNTASGASIFFAEADVPEAVVMNPRNDGTYLFTGKGTLPGRYTQGAFNRNVRPVIGELSEVSARLTLSAEERRLLDDFVRFELEAYANRYVDAVDAWYRAWGVRADSADWLQVLLKQLVRPGSAFDAHLRTTAIQTQLDLDVERYPLFAPFAQRLEKYAPLQKVMAQGEDGARELDQYLAVLEQMQLALQPRAAGGAIAGGGGKEGPGAEGEGAAPALGLDERLSPVGRTSLAILQGEPGTFADMVVEWVDSVKLDEQLARPFLAPVEQLYAVGLREVEGVTAEVWRAQVVPELVPLATAFPFDRNASRDVRPSELVAVLDPRTGRFHELRRRFLDPVLRPGPDTVRRRLGTRRSVQLPPALRATLADVDRVTAALFDAQGQPKPVQLRVSPVPFEAGSDRRETLTLVYLSAGASSIFNFNQQPAVRTLELDWTQPTRSQLGIELTHAVSGQKTYPTPIVSPPAPWSLLRLLASGREERRALAWTFRHGREGDPMETQVRFTLHDDPWSLFTLRGVVPERLAARRGP